MAKQHRGYRLEEDLIGEVDAYAEGSGKTQSAAVAELLSLGLRALDGGGEAGEARQDAQGLEDLRQAVRTLTAQLEAKDEQIREQGEVMRSQLEAKDEQIRGLMALTNNAQALQASQAARLEGGVVADLGDAEDVEPVDEDALLSDDGDSSGRVAVENERRGREEVDSGQTAQGGSHGALTQEEAKRDGGGQEPLTLRQRIGRWLLG